MRLLGSDRYSPRQSRDEGTAAVETVMLFPVIALVVVAILEFGNLWQLQHTLTIASREAARAAVIYNPTWTTKDREDAAQTAVNTFFGDSTGQTHPRLPKVGTLKVNFPTPGNSTGQTFTVSVEVRSSDGGVFLLLDKLIPPLKDITISGVSTMRIE
jgi:Flp pilus assembly protein TadG